MLPSFRPLGAPRSLRGRTLGNLQWGMPTRYRPYDPNQSYLLAPSLHEWLPEDHLAYFISDTGTRWTRAHSTVPTYQGDGRRNRPFDRRMMVNPLYGYARG